MTDTYWNVQGTYQHFLPALQKLIPTKGDIKGSKNKALERFRKASNLYYRFYNDGDTGIGFYRLFGVDSYTPNLNGAVEKKMDEIIVAAALEQLGTRPLGQ